jgi:hypothetical protein
MPDSETMDSICVVILEKFLPWVAILRDF